MTQSPVSESARSGFVGRLACGLVVLLACTPYVASATADEADEFFESRIRPVLVQECFACHGGQQVNGNLRVDSREALLAGGDRGPALLPGNADGSLLIQAVRRHHAEVKMPPEVELPAAAVADLAIWIDQGASWPKLAGEFALSAASATDSTRHWSFQPLKDPPVPQVASPWPTSPLDNFILQELNARGLTPVAAADKRILLRRATFDLCGLPPTPDELAAFLADESPTAFAKVVDRLLQSPRYGERWGRHWLDVVRYADTAGNPPDFPVPQAYRYRDYVIRAFNQDKPFDRFLHEQVAGDLLPSAMPPQGDLSGPAADTPPDGHYDPIVATGYLAIHRRSSSRADGTADHLEIEDLIDNLGKSILGLSISCARCHDHKFDPISARDYYALYGIFQSTRFPFPGTEGNAVQQNFIPLGGGQTAYAVAEGTPGDARIQRGGEPGQQEESVPRGFLQVLGGQGLPPGFPGSGRLVLANWLTNWEQNPLTVRVLANRVWQHHFGRGLVSTANDFGIRGSPPSHPELLDYLALRFIEGGWSIKELHRTIMLSSTYQLASTGRPEQGAADPSQDLLWKFPRHRLDAESIRDTLLAVSGELDHSPAAAHPFPESGSVTFSQHAPFDAVYESQRRSVYLMQQRIKRHPYLALFDGADPNSSTAGRASTSNPLQALFQMNDALVHRCAHRLAERVLAAQPDDAERLRLAFELTLGRPPSAHETRQCQAHLGSFAARLRENSVPDEQLAVGAWASLARVLLSTNEFLYVD